MTGDVMSDVVNEDEKAYAMIRANVEANRRLESFYPPCAPVELIMSMETVLEQRRKIAEICARMRAREAGMTRELVE